MSDSLDLVILRTIESDFEMNMITAILEDNNIPFIVKDKGAGNYMRIITGSSPFRTDIMVESKSYDRAIELIAPIIGED